MTLLGSLPPSLPPPALAPTFVPTTLPPPPAPPPPGHLELALRNFRRAVGRLETVAVTALVTTVLMLVQNLLSALGVTNWAVAVGYEAFGVTWNFHYGDGIQAGLGVAIALVVIVGVVNAFMGLVAWRRAVPELRASSREHGELHSQWVANSIRDARRTGFSVLGFVLVALGIGLVVGALDIILWSTGQSFIPSAPVNLLESVAMAAVLVLAYLYGTRHLMGAVSGIAPPLVLGGLVVDQQWIILGALVGIVGSVSSLYWPLGVVTALSLAMVLRGVHGFKQGYEVLVLTTPAPLRLPRVAAATAVRPHA